MFENVLANIPIVISQTSEAVEESSTLIEQLSPMNQIRIFMGLFTIAVLGVVIFIVIKAGSHMVKGFSAAANRLPAKTLPNEDDWATKPLNDESCEEQDDDAATEA